MALFGRKNNKNDKLNLCEEFEIHDEILDKISGEMPSEDTLLSLSELFKTFGDRTRIKILYALFEDEVCVCDIAKLLDMTVSAISHQLRVLKSAGLVRFRKDGKTCYYSLADNHVKTIIAQGLSHVTEV